MVMFDATNKGAGPNNIPVGGQPTGTAVAIDADFGPVILIDASGASGNLVLTWSNLATNGVYYVNFLQGSTQRQIASSNVAIKWAGGSGPTFGATTTNWIVLLYDGTNLQELSRSLANA